MSAVCDFLFFFRHSPSKKKYTELIIKYVNKNKKKDDMVGGEKTTHTIPLSIAVLIKQYD